ncbi:CMRF35-like molecule 6 isoform X1 [Camelus ferus]|uniref:CMRF35-like molecule 6 isoform X1 n=1 Tax=Camelus ferus TaxID=419612 RepID=A0A8B8R6E8_CAMFR|nr:CMRF35-like molecule 6 isoform X1 [Camelus ferus]
MTPRDGALWLPSALLLLHVPGCWSLSGPHRVTGVVGGSLSVQCRYKKEFIDHIKFWCKSPCLLSWRMVETTESEREVRNDRVSIRDHPASLTFTVTLENLRMDDAGTYCCGIDKSLSFDLTSEVEVSVFPAAKRSTSTPDSPTTLLAPTWSTVSGQETPDPGQHSRSLLGSVHFLLLVFLKVPLLLGMLGAVLWVNRPQRSSGNQQHLLPIHPDPGPQPPLVDGNDL